MNREFVTYIQAVALKELGFDEPCFGCYDEKGVFGLTVMSIKQYYTNSKEDNWNCAAPLYQQAFEWMREKYKLHSYIYSDYSWNISGGIWDLNEHKDSRYDWDSDTYTTYEEAQDACIDKLIELVKNG